MAVPKKKTSKQKTRSRRAHDSISQVAISFDSKTGEAKRPHHISLKDGFYNNRQVFEKPISEENQSSAQETE